MTKEVGFRERASKMSPLAWKTEEGAYPVSEARNTGGFYKQISPESLQKECHLADILILAP